MFIISLHFEMMPETFPYIGPTLSFLFWSASESCGLLDTALFGTPFMPSLVLLNPPRSRCRQAARASRAMRRQRTVMNWAARIGQIG